MTAWLDMALYPGSDPDTVLTAEQTHLLRGLLTQPAPDVPDDVWRRMLEVTWTTLAGDEGDGEADGSASSEHHDVDGDAGTGAVVTDWSGPHTPSAFLGHDVVEDFSVDTNDDVW